MGSHRENLANVRELVLISASIRELAGGEIPAKVVSKAQG